MSLLVLVLLVLVLLRLLQLLSQPPVPAIDIDANKSPQ